METTGQIIQYDFIPNDAPLKAGFARVESESKSHVSVVNSHLKGIGSSINVNEHFQNSVKKVESEAKSHVGRLNSIFSHVGEGVKEKLGGMVSGVASVFGGGFLLNVVQGGEQAIEKIAEMGLEFAETYEKAHLRMTAFTGDVRQSTVVLQELHNIAVDRALEFAPLADAAFKLQEIGISGPKVVGILSGITAQAQALGRGSQDVGRVVGMLEMMQDSGKAAGRGLIQLERQGYQVFGTLSKMTGISNKELSKMFTSGKVDAKAAIELLTQGWDKEFGEVAKKVTHTFSDEQVRGMQIAGPQLATALGPVIEGATHVVEDLNRVVQKVGPKFAEGISGLITGPIQATISVLDQLLSRLGLLSTVSEKLGGEVKLQTPGVSTGPKFSSQLQFLHSPQQKIGQGGSAYGELSLDQIIANPNFQAFLAALSSGGFEGGDFTTGYGGRRIDLSKGLSGVPRSVIQSGPNAGRKTSAFGIGQFEKGTYKDWALGAGLNPEDISPEMQQKVLAYGLKKLGALDKVLEGKFAEAISMKSVISTWTSLPGGIEARGHTINQFLAATSRGGGSEGGDLSNVNTKIQQLLANDFKEMVDEMFGRITRGRGTLGWSMEGDIASHQRIPEPGVYPRALTPEDQVKRAEVEKNLIAIENTYITFVDLNAKRQKELSELYQQKARLEREATARYNAANPGVIVGTMQQLGGGQPQFAPPIEYAPPKLRRGISPGTITQPEPSALEQSISASRPLSSFEKRVEESSAALGKLINSTDQLASVQDQDANALKIRRLESITGEARRKLQEGSDTFAVRQSEVDAIVGIPKSIASTAFEFITKFDFTMKSAQQLLVGGLRSVIVEPIGRIVQTQIDKWVTQMLVNLLGEKIMGSAKVSSETANTIALGVNTAALLANTAAIGADAGSNILDTVLQGAAAGSSGGGRTGGIVKYARGTLNFPGGVGMVGEEGPELAHLPSGTHIYNKQETEGMLSRAGRSGSGRGGNTTFNINLNAPVVGGSSYSSPRSRREMVEMLQPALMEVLSQAA